MKTVILAGGLDTRLAEETQVRPKPMVEIGGKPMLWHLMNIYATYGFCEFVAAPIAQSYDQTYGVQVAMARCGNIYTGELNWSRVAPGTIRSLHFGERPTVRSDAGYTRDYVYVEDAVAAYLRRAEMLDPEDVRGQAFNFGPAQPHSVRDVIGALQCLVRREDLDLDIRNGARAEIRHQYLDSAKARRPLDWRPLDQGLGRSVASYQEFLGRAA